MLGRPAFRRRGMQQLVGIVGHEMATIHFHRADASPATQPTSLRSKGCRRSRPPSPMGARLSAAERAFDRDECRSECRTGDESSACQCLYAGFLTVSDFYEDYAMAGDGRTECIVECAAYRGAARGLARCAGHEARQLRPLHGHLMRREAAVEKAYRRGAVRKRPRPIFRADPASRFAMRRARVDPDPRRRLRRW